MRIQLFALAAALLVLSAFGQVTPTIMLDPSTGTMLTPAVTNFLRWNVLNQAGFIRQVDAIAGIAGQAPYRSGEHVFVIDAGTFGGGGPAMFQHDALSSEATNTTDILAASPGRWKAKRVYGSGGTPSFADITGKPETLSGYGITNALPLTAGSNVLLSGDLYLSAFVLGGTRYTSVVSSASGSVTVNSETNTVTNFVAGADIAPVRTNGTAAFTVTGTTGTGDLVRSNAPTLRDVSFLGTSAFNQLDVTTLTAGNFSSTNANLITPKLGDATGASLDITNSIRQRNVTASRFTVYGADGYLTNDIAETGTGAPVRAVSPALTGTPTAPTPSSGDTSTQIATTAFVSNAVASVSGAPGTIGANGTGSNTNINDSSTVAATGSGGSITLATVLPSVTVITNPGTGTYNVPTGARFLDVTAWAGGGSGGSGRRGLTNTVCAGGSGGGGGAGGRWIIPIAALAGATTIPYTNGAGGLGGAAQATASSNGNPGTNGSPTSFGNFILLTGGGGGSAGTASAGTGGTAGAANAMWPGLLGGAASGSGSGGTSPTDDTTATYLNNQMHAAGGGYGGGITNTGVAGAGSRGGISSPWALNVRGTTGYGASGAVNGNGGDGQSPHSAFISPGCGGGGGGASLTTNGGNGGRGALYGAGGGGGGAGADTGGNSGAGGDGAPGAIMIIAY